VARLVLEDPDGNLFPCSGALLRNGCHVVTAAHCFAEHAIQRVEVGFNNGFTEIVDVATNVVIHPDWDGVFENGNDLAVISLSQVVQGINGFFLPPFDPQPPTRVEMFGWGPSGQGLLQEALFPFGTLRSGVNFYDARGLPGDLYQFDFDSDPAQNTVMIDRDGSGPHPPVHAEVMTAAGDSGGPSADLEIGLIGIHSAIQRGVNDVDGVANSSFGELGYDTPVFPHKDFIEQAPACPIAPVDADADGVGDTEDNCPHVANADQADAGGVGSGSAPDGVGDACQCGDANGDGSVTLNDALAILRSSLVPPTGSVTVPALCDVGGAPSPATQDCTLADAVLIRRALLVPPTATLAQSCAPAVAP
jgi:hypothetical protein